MKNKRISFRLLIAFLVFLALTATGCNKNNASNSESESQIKNESLIDEESQTDEENQSDSEIESTNKEDTESNSDTSTFDDSENPSQENEIISTEIESESSQLEQIPTSDPYEGMSTEEFYADYKPATSLADALYRSKHGFLSGSLEVPGQYAEDAEYRPMENGAYLRNVDTYYLDDGQTYVVVDGNGQEVMRIYKGGGYITLEEVAAYMYAFGGSSDNLPANYTSKKKMQPKNSIWGEYLRLNHSYFIGNTNKYPYEPELPNISGCGGSSQYYEMDIGTTGTETPGYAAKLYNNGITISRGAARLVYTRQDLNGNGVYEQNEVYVFYTHNHYNDFREYLNYYGGWGEMFGNVTGGGEYSSKTNCNPTPYVPTGYKSFMES